MLLPAPDCRGDEEKAEEAAGDVAVVDGGAIGVTNAAGDKHEPDPLGSDRR